MGCLECIISMDGKLQGKERSNRRVIFIISAIEMAAGLFFLIFDHNTPIGAVTDVTFILNSAAMLLPLLLRTEITKNMVRAWVCVYAFGILLSDLEMRVVANSAIAIWSAFVLLADLALVMRLGSRFAAGLVSVVAGWVVLNFVEKIFRFGLYDTPGTATSEYRWEHIAESSDCSTPPCPIGFNKAFLDLFVTLMVLVIDFIATRGFAEEVEKEQAAMAHTIETVAAIAALLARYDVDTVAEMLQEAEGRLPVEMYEALRRLEQNLRAYQPYLPAILLEQQGRMDSVPTSGSPRSAPGLANSQAAILFTDVLASTSIWETAPTAMRKGLHTHNEVVRRAIRAFCGYEVKTIGDSFMVAFPDACAAVDFALSVQSGLVAAEWPSALLDVPICKATSLWGGLTVRIGLNEGPVNAETNSLTGRVDYFGHTVNVAARLEGVCAPGAVAMPSDIWGRVRGRCAPAVYSDAGVPSLRGVSERVPVCHIWPAHLHGRQHETLPARTHAQSASSTPSVALAPMREGGATVAILRPSGSDSLSVASIGHRLEMVMPLLDQSGGAITALIGGQMFVAWNLSKQTPAHAEGALRFAQRILRPQLLACLSLGIASGRVQHGDVGTSQRFVTVAGEPVEASFEMLQRARDMGVRCLYTAADALVTVAMRKLMHTASVSVELPTLGTVYEVAEQEEE